MDPKVALVIECLAKFNDQYVKDKDPNTKLNVEKLILDLESHDSLDGIKNDPDYRTAIIAAGAIYTHSLNAADVGGIPTNLCDTIRTLYDLVQTFPRDSEITTNALRDFQKILADCN